MGRGRRGRGRARARARGRARARNQPPSRRAASRSTTSSSEAEQSSQAESTVAQSTSTPTEERLPPSEIEFTAGLASPGHDVAQSTATSSQEVESRSGAMNTVRHSVLLPLAVLPILM